jgi:hypothetical protein
LGGDLASVRRDQAILGAADQLTGAASYDVHAAQGANGSLLREYVDRAGHVFAVTWQGPRSPDFASLLGSHAARYLAVARQHVGSHHVVTVNEPGLSVTTLRLPRGWQVTASEPASIPAAMNRQEIR